MSISSLLSTIRSEQRFPGDKNEFLQSKFSFQKSKDKSMKKDDGYCKIYQCCYLVKEENASSDLVDWVSKKGLEIV